MSNTLTQILFLSLVVFLGQFILPWYILVILALLFGILFAKTWKSAFFIPFLSILLVWSLYPLVISIQDDFRTANVIGNVFGAVPAWAILIINGLIFGFLAAIAGLNGFFLRNVISK